VLLSLAADQLSAPTSTGSAVSPEPSAPGLKQVPQRSAAWRSARWCRRDHSTTPSPRRRSRWCCMSGVVIDSAWLRQQLGLDDKSAARNTAERTNIT
jgi:hypothetical protein